MAGREVDPRMVHTLAEALAAGGRAGAAAQGRAALAEQRARRAVRADREGSVGDRPGPKSAGRCVRLDFVPRCGAFWV